MSKEETAMAAGLALLAALMITEAARAARALVKEMRRRKESRAWRAALGWEEDADD